MCTFDTIFIVSLLILSLCILLLILDKLSKRKTSKLNVLFVTICSIIIMCYISCISFGETDIIVEHTPIYKVDSNYIVRDINCNRVYIKENDILKLILLPSNYIIKESDDSAELQKIRTQKSLGPLIRWSDVNIVWLPVD